MSQTNWEADKMWVFFYVSPSLWAFFICLVRLIRDFWYNFSGIVFGMKYELGFLALWFMFFFIRRHKFFLGSHLDVSFHVWITCLHFFFLYYFIRLVYLIFYGSGCKRMIHASVMFNLNVFVYLYSVNLTVFDLIFFNGDFFPLWSLCSFNLCYFFIAGWMYIFMIICWKGISRHLPKHFKLREKFHLIQLVYMKRKNMCYFLLFFI